MTKKLKKYTKHVVHQMCILNGFIHKLKKLEEES
jgi:hypothetical protein